MQHNNVEVDQQMKSWQGTENVQSLLRLGHEMDIKCPCCIRCGGRMAMVKE